MLLMDPTMMEKICLVGEEEKEILIFSCPQQSWGAWWLPVSIHHILSDFCTQTLWYLAPPSSTQNISGVRLLPASAGRAMPECPCRCPVPRLQAEGTCLFHHPLPHSSCCFNKKDERKQCSLFFFLVMVPATCLLFIFTITFIDKKMNKILVSQKKFENIQSTNQYVGTYTPTWLNRLI